MAYHRDLAVRLQTAGALYQGWESVTIRQSLEQAANTFELTVSDERASDLNNQPIAKGARCRILIGDTPVINGFVGRRKPSFGNTTHKITLSGRDITGDLVDASAIVPNQELHNVTLKEAADSLCAPFNITVNCPAPGAKFEKFAVNEGETVFQCLESHAKQRGLLIYTLGDGILQINRPSPIDSGVTLEEGVNILSGSADHNDDDLYHQYISKSQAGSRHRNQATATDPSIRAGRVLIVRAEKSNETTSNQHRADYEMKLRQAKATRASLVVQGWEYAAGKVWQPNLLVNLKCPSLDIEGQFLLASTALSSSDGAGTLGTLAFVKPEVYALT